MKKTLLPVICAFAISALKVNAQTKIYDFPFDGSYDAIVGTGTFNGNSGMSIISHLNGALSINNSTGVTSSLTAIPVGNSARSISLWFNRQGGGNTGMFSYGTSGQEFGIMFDASGGLVFTHDGVNTPLSIPGVSYNTWHHLVITHSGTEVNVYFNGSLKNTIQISLNTSSGVFKLGNVVGYFDELRIYDDALSLAQVQADYTYIPTSPCNLVSMYKFNNSATNQYGINAFDNAAYDVGKVNQGLLVLGSTKTATISNLPSGSSPRTVTMWLYRGSGTTVSTYPGIFYYGGLTSQSGDRFGMYYNNTGALVFQGYGSGYDHLVQNTSTSSGQWRHIAITYSGSSVSVYMNGTLADTWTVSLNTNTDGKFIIGGANSYGVYDDLRIYNAELNASQIQDIYTNIESHNCNLATNIEAVNLETNQLNVYPNPATTNLTLNNIVDGSTVSIIDVSGKVVYKEKIETNTTTIETKNLANGIYVIQLENNGAVAYKKLVIHK